MKIYLAAYPRGIHRIRELLEPRELDLDPSTFPSPVEANLRLDRHDPYFEFSFDLFTHVSAQCDRCAADYSLELRVTRSMLYVLGSSTALKDTDDPELGFIPPGATELDLTSDMRDFLILGLPEKNLCREDCQGLCPRCGTNLNIESCSCQALSF